MNEIEPLNLLTTLVIESQVYLNKFSSILNRLTNIEYSEEWVLTELKRLQLHSDENILFILGILLKVKIASRTDLGKKIIDNAISRYILYLDDEKD